MLWHNLSLGLYRIFSSLIFLSRHVHIGVNGERDKKKGDVVVEIMIDGLESMESPRYELIYNLSSIYKNALYNICVYFNRFFYVYLQILVLK